MASWRDREIKGVLLDITGALFESGSREPIEGSVEAIQRLDYINYNQRLDYINYNLISSPVVNVVYKGERKSVAGHN